MKATAAPLLRCLNPCPDVRNLCLLGLPQLSLKPPDKSGARSLPSGTLRAGLAH